MTETATELDQVQAEARANAEWIDGKLREGRTWDLQFLRFRPVRELTDVLTQASELDADPDREILPATITTLTEAIALARGHTGGPSNPPTGYVALFYSPSEPEVAAVLEQAAELGRKLHAQLPGGAYGWRWARQETTDPVSRTVTLTFTASHPRLPETAAIAPPVEPPPVEPPPTVPPAPPVTPPPPAAAGAADETLPPAE